MAIINRYLSINHNQPPHTGLSETSELAGLKSLTRPYTLSMSWSYKRMIKEGWIEDPDLTTVTTWPLTTNTQTKTPSTLTFIKLGWRNLCSPSIARMIACSCFKNTSTLCKLYLIESLTMMKILRSTYQMPPSIDVKGHSLNQQGHGGPSSIVNAVSYAF